MKRLSDTEFMALAARGFDILDSINRKLDELDVVHEAEVQRELAE